MLIDEVNDFTSFDATVQKTSMITFSTGFLGETLPIVKTNIGSSGKITQNV